ncbi:MAG: hypothetical protein AAF915_23965 [Cyanobacteria bacterium P01_D01_bin.50]
MPWENLGIYFIKDDWVLTPPVTRELFRVKHFKIYQAEKYYLKGVIAQAFKDSFGINTFSDKRFGYRPDPEVFEFYFPAGLGQHSLAFKRLDNSDTSWRIEVEAFYSEDAELDYLNYLQARFGNINIEEIIVALYPRAKQSEDLVPNSKVVKLEAMKPKLISPSDLLRRKYSVRTGMQGVILATGFNENGKPKQLLEDIPPNYNYDLPSTDNSIYHGEIWAKSYSDTKFSITQYLTDVLTEEEIAESNETDPTSETDPTPENAAE